MQEALTPELDRLCGNSECEVDLSAALEAGDKSKYCSTRCKGRAYRANRRRRASELSSKFCTGCQEEKGIEHFSQPWVHYCRPCANARSREDYIARGGAEYAYAKGLKYHYGLSVDEYAARLEAQGGRCAICREESPQRLHVDHDHRTGAVRDLLCEGCNHAIGKAQEDPARLRAMADYLERHTAAPER
ncbi:endonuclease VII domain-containing protein [Streptomyces sp. Wb2n-11]|uniref:endonuclease VII domain-containing protein n=1 Tax=Streptomyces sp. Wb2n-11 TaxID=1030533 RepID=UPI000ADC60FE|nr:endonuclease VII domain-containing protein [Streptomyces sp. Wb2n-11]